MSKRKRSKSKNKGAVQEYPKRKVLKVQVKDVPPIDAAVLPHLPEPVKALVEAVHAGHVEEIHFAEHVDPTLWERLKKLFGMGDTPPATGGQGDEPKP